MGGDGEVPAGEGKRDCSLCVLTHQFLKHMSQHGTRAVNLSSTAQELQTRRRLYDVTNVLEGVGLLRKTSPNHVQWVNLEADSALGTARFKAIHEERLQRLDDLKARMQDAVSLLHERVTQMASEQDTQPLLYLRKTDLSQIEDLQGQQVVVVRASQDTTLTIPDPHRGCESEADASPKFKAVIKSRTGPLAVRVMKAADEALDARPQAKPGEGDVPSSTHLSSSPPSKDAEFCGVAAHDTQSPHTAICGPCHTADDPASGASSAQSAQENDLRMTSLVSPPNDFQHSAFWAPVTPLPGSHRDDDELDVSQQLDFLCK